MEPRQIKRKPSFIIRYCSIVFVTSRVNIETVGGMEEHRMSTENVGFFANFKENIQGVYKVFRYSFATIPSIEGKMIIILKREHFKIRLDHTL